MITINRFNQAISQGVLQVDIDVIKKDTHIQIKNTQTNEKKVIIQPFVSDKDAWHNVTPIIHWYDVMVEVDKAGWLG